VFNIESSSTSLILNYSHIVNSPKGTTSLVLQLNCITDIPLELGVELVKINPEVMEIKRATASSP